MEGIKAIVFDLEGTIVDVEFVHHMAHVLAAKEVAGVDWSIEECFQRIPHFIGGPTASIAEDFGVSSGRKVDAARFVERDEFHYEKMLEAIEIKPRDGFLDVLEELKLLGIGVGIGSATPPKYAEILLGESGLKDMFDLNSIVLAHTLSDSPTRMKTEVWLESARRAKTFSQNLLVFEDAPRGIRGAKEVGALGVGMPVFNHPRTIIDLIEAGACRIFMDWREMNIRNLLWNLNNRP